MDVVPLPATVGVDFLRLPPSNRELGPPPGRTIDVMVRRGCFGVMHYQLDGPRDGELCVWVHGLGDFSYRSDLLAGALIAGGYRVLRFDFFGRGWSDSPAAAGYDMDMYIGQMRALFETLTLGGRRKTLIGHSMGGLIAQGYTEKYPGDVARLVLLAPAGVMTSSKLPPCLSGLQCLFDRHQPQGASSPSSYSSVLVRRAMGPTGACESMTPSMSRLSHPRRRGSA